MPPKLLQYILDIESDIGEIESIKQKTPKDFNNFSNVIIFQRAVERDIEISGEAVSQIRKDAPVAARTIIISRLPSAPL